MIVAYDLGGASRGQVPAPLSVEWVDRDGEIPTAKISYSEHAPRFAELGEAVEIAYLLPDGKNWVEPPNARFVVGDESWERLRDGAKVRSYDCVGLASEFAYHHLTEGAGTERTFTQVTAGALIAAFVAEVKAAGGLQWLTLGFSAERDSRGEAWPYYLEDGTPQGTQVHTATIPLRTKDLLTLLQELPRVQWWMQGRTLHLAPWKPGTSNPVHLPDVLMSESPEKLRHASVRSHIRVVGDEGKSWLFPVPGANAAYGRRVGLVQAQGVTDEGSARMIAETRFPDARDAAESFTRQWRVTDGTPWLPGRDIAVRDWITADTAEGKARPARVAGMSIQEAKGGRSAFVTLGTIQDGLLLKLAKAQRSAAGGVGVMQGTPKPVPPSVPGLQWPEAPTGLQVTAGTWTASDGKRQGHLSMSWDPVTVDTSGNVVSIDRYQVRARRTSNPATTFQDIAAPNGTTATVTRTDIAAGETWAVIVAAVSEPNTGVFSAPVSVTVQQDTSAPEVPSIPNVSSTPATLVVEWDGLDYQGQAMAPDLSHVVVQLEGITQTWNLTRTSKSVRINAGPGEVLAAASVHRARLKAVDVAGNESGWSPWSGHVTIKSAVQWPATPTGLVVAAETWTTSEGLYRGRVTATWNAVTKDVAGESVDIETYTVRARRAAGQFATEWFDLITTSGLTGSGSSDLMEVGDRWEFVVGAKSRDGHTGPFSTPPVSVIIPPDTIKPPAPSMPVVTSDLGILTVEWDGLTSTAGAMPPDLSHLSVHITGIAEPWTLDKVTKLLHITSGEGQALQIGTAYTVQLRAVDYAGNESALSNAADPVTVKTATHGLQEAIDQIEAEFRAADQALQGQIDSIVISSSGGIVTWMGPTVPVAPEQRPHMAGDIWWDTTAKVQKRYDGTNWVVFQIGNAGIADLNAAKIAGTLTGTQIANSAITGTHLASGSVDVNKLADGSVSAAKLNPTVSASITAAQSAADTAKADAAAAAGIAGGKADVLIQSTTPPAAMQKATTLWIDTTGGANTPKRWSGSTWTVVTDKAASDAAATAAAAQTAANNAVSTANAAAATANSALTAANGKNTNHYVTGVPAGSLGVLGDLAFVRASVTAPYTKVYEKTGATTWTEKQFTGAVVTQLDAGSITTGTLSADRIGANALTATHIAAGAIGTEELAANAVVAGKIAAAQITASHMVAGTITAASGIIATAAITDANIFNLDAAKITTGLLDSARIRAGAAWFQDKVLIGNADELVHDPTWQLPALNTDRTRTGWTVAPGVVTHTRATAEDFYLGLTSDWADQRSRLPLKQGVRYRIEATVRLNTAGNVGLMWRTSDTSFGYITGPTALGAGVDYVLTGEFTWGASAGTFGVRLDQPGTIRNVSVRSMLSQVLIQDGIITAPKIASNAVVADKIAGGAVTALKLSADALDFKSAKGMTITSSIVTTTGVANRGIWLNGSDNTLKAFSDTGAETFRVEGATGLVSIAGSFRTRGAYPWLDIDRGLWASFAGLQWTVGPGWQTKPEILTNAAKWGIDLAGGLYIRGGNYHNLTMRPEVALRSGRPVDGADQYWPEVDVLLGTFSGGVRGRIRLQDVGQEKTAIYQWSDFWKAETKGGGMMIEMPVPGTVHDMSMRSLTGGITLFAGNGWIRPENIGSTTGGEDLRLEGNWRMTFQSSLSRDKLEQQEMGVLYELLELRGKTWIDRVRREADPTFDVRYGGVIFEDVERVSRAHGGSLDFALIHRDGGKPSGINHNALFSAFLDVMADMDRRIRVLEAPRIAA